MDVGHASLDIHELLYMSFWPAGTIEKDQARRNVDVPGFFVTSLEQDKQRMGRCYDERYVFEGLDTERLAEYCRRRIEQEKAFNLQHKNCSTMVAQSLLGALDRFIENMGRSKRESDHVVSAISAIKSLARPRSRQSGCIWTPLRVRDLARLLLDIIPGEFEVGSHAGEASGPSSRIAKVTTEAVNRTVIDPKLGNDERETKFSPKGKFSKLAPVPKIGWWPF
jgi:hypothetical protein